MGINDTDLMYRLLQRGANPNYRYGMDGRGPRALYYAAADGKSDAVSLLLRYGATVERRDLAVAILNGHVDVVAQMLGADADPHWILPDGRTVLEEAARCPVPVRADMIALVRQWTDGAGR